MSEQGDKDSLQVFLRLAGRPVVLVGEGPVADAQRRLLQRAGARIVEEGSKAALAIVVDDIAAVSRLKVRGALVYAVDRPDLCDFTLPTTVDREPARVADRTRAVAPGITKAVRRPIGTLLRSMLGALAARLGRVIAAIRRPLPKFRRERVALELALARGGPLEPLAAELQPSAEGPGDAARGEAEQPPDQRTAN